MQVRFLVLVTAAALAVPAVAAAKGPSQASISGPGLGKPIVFGSGGGDPAGGTPLWTLTQESGFFPAMFGQSPNPMLSGKPKGELGPRYSVVYLVPGPNGKSTIRQDLYPYAAGGPVSYMRAGQPFWNGEKSRGGWYQGLFTLKSTLTRAGLPATPSSGGNGSGTGVPGWLWGIVGVSGALVLVGVGTALVVRRRPSAAAA